MEAVGRPTLSPNLLLLLLLPLMMLLLMPPPKTRPKPLSPQAAHAADMLKAFSRESREI